MENPKYNQIEIHEQGLEILIPSPITAGYLTVDDSPLVHLTASFGQTLMR